jgi:hypothetical protein
MGMMKLVLFAKYYWNDHVKEYEMGRACSTLGDERNGGKARRKETTRKT